MLQFTKYCTHKFNQRTYQKKNNSFIFFSEDCPTSVPDLQHSDSHCHNFGNGDTCYVTCRGQPNGQSSEYVCSHGAWLGREPQCSRILYLNTLFFTKWWFYNLQATGIAREVGQI